MSLLCVALIVNLSCVDPIIFDIATESSSSVVVDGLITNLPGPYEVQLKRPIQINGPMVVGQPISAKSVVIMDNLGNEEQLTEIRTGTYSTRPDGIRGTIGREYKIKITLLDGRIFESAYDRLSPQGELQSIEEEFEEYQPPGEPSTYRYRILASGNTPTDEDVYTRLRFEGTYIANTLPQLHMDSECYTPPCGCLAPLPCSNYAIVNGELKLGYKIDPRFDEPVFYPGLSCECCRCWVTESETNPTIESTRLQSNGQFHRIAVGTVPVTYYRFQEKYRVTVTQMSVTKNAFMYWEAVASQKEAIGSLFQPISGRIPTSIHELDGNASLLGLFYAASVSTQQLYLDRNTHFVSIPTPVNCTGRVGPMGQSCLSIPGASTSPPPDWIN